ncbi:MAG: T9SS type A sorting domain-containing protein [Bacteroidia bacterium]|nr:T9SS type A sorting domain-containing protein [Bacteroidia bacterium]
MIYSIINIHNTIARAMNIRNRVLTLLILTTLTSLVATQDCWSQSVAGGGAHSLVLYPTGAVSATGLNDWGQLGDGSTTNRTTLVRVTELNGVTAVSAGQHFSLALKENGTVWAWGLGGHGQLGDGTQTTRLTPVQVSGLSGVTAISCGQEYSLALKNDGTVWAWGYNGEGELGDGSTVWRVTPVQVSGLAGVVAIAGGWRHSLALKDDGTVWAWGLNTDGQLGDGTTTTKLSPVQVAGLCGITAISVGWTHSLAVKADGTVWAWGLNVNGQLGDGTTTTRPTPVQVTGLSEIVATSAGRYHSLAKRADGTVRAWGVGGELGDGSTVTRLTPVQVLGLSGITSISSGAEHGLAMKNDESVYAWGANWFGQLGDGTTDWRLTPFQMIPTVDAGPDLTLTLGYGDQSKTITAVASGGTPPYSYMWSTNQTTASITVSPMLTTVYTVTITDASNRTATDNVTVTVIDWRCGIQNNKVKICHNGHEICVDASAVPAHLEHGDNLGSCQTPKVESNTNTSNFFLSQNFPNPFNPTTTISYSLPERAVVQLRVYDLIGREIAVLVNGEREAGVHTVLFDAHALDAGVYFYRLFAGNEVLSGAMTLVK